MNQLNQSFKLTLIDVLAGQQKSPEYLKINPLGVVPYLVTETGYGIGESNAMLWYLAEGSHLIPSEKTDRAEILQWMFFEQSKLEPYISPARFFTTILPDQKDARASDITMWQADAEMGLSRLNTHLESQKFMLKSGYSIADIALFGYVHVLEEAGLSLADFPEIGSWIHSVTQTNGYRPLTELGQPKSMAA
jgi:glutathione S-transferase